MGLSHPAFLCLTIESMEHFHRLITIISLITLCLGLGCGRNDELQSNESTAQKIVLQTDWFAQPEHGGFYQALAKGFYAEEGLSVEILQGGPNAMSTQKVIRGRAHFAMNRADAVCKMTSRDIDVKMVMSTLQHDPQGILLHDSSPVRSFEDLDGKQVMAIPGLSWIRWIEAKYGIQLEIVPHDFGLQRFLNDESFIQQCLVTNEPFYAQLAGAEPRVMRLKESGFDPYHGIYCLSSLLDDNPEMVRRFIRASIRGWKDFILNDPQPAFDMIAARNPKMSPEFMNYCYQSMQLEKLVTGTNSTGDLIGSMDPSRMLFLENELISLGLLEIEPDTDLDWYTMEFLPKHGDEPVYARP